eukprot:TRINITY_DN7280_c1_g1_i1.p1 TRINITY_DN7280_c1_g1~~TRINITY_DN7280_c1_g1_i1.p1  ORF type:complete len:258 (-),score=54.19 TRINITY_DN7280_c1_g1_i1:123-806(-)
MRFIQKLLEFVQHVSPQGADDQLISFCTDKQVYFMEQPLGDLDELHLGKPSIDIHDEDPERAQETVAKLIEAQLKKSDHLTHFVRKYSMDEKRQFVHFFKMLYEEDDEDQKQPFDVERVGVSQEEIFGERKVDGDDVRLSTLPIDRGFLLTPQDAASRPLFWEMSPDRSGAIKEFGKRLEHCVNDLRQEGRRPWIQIMLYKIQPLIADGDNESFFWCAHAFHDSAST